MVLSPAPPHQTVRSVFLNISFEVIDTGLPCSLSYGLSYLSSLSPRDFHLSVMVVCVKIDASVFPFFGQGRQLCLIVTRLHPNLLSLRPVGSLSSLSEPLSRNLVLQFPFTSPSSYMVELPNSHCWTLTSKSYVLYGIPYKSTPFNRQQNASNTT